ncbi:MAG: SDR family oxidoreductase [Polyangiaceae bacterium]|nr:SDR family oxidoreductase [Polyangiaceae bacterium]
MSTQHPLSGESTDDQSEELGRAIALLERFVHEPDSWVRVLPEDRERLLIAAGRLSRPSPDEKRRRARAFRKKDRNETRTRDEALLSTAALRKQKDLSAFLPPAVHPLVGLLPGDGNPAESTTAEPASESNEERLEEPRACYVCKAPYDRVHFFYHSMCAACAALNYQKRSQAAPMDGRVALVTGARIKIGFHTALKLLRAGARVIVTTRFPVDAARRFAAEDDAETWQSRLEIHGLDLRHTPSVERFAASLLARLDRLDVLINNAAQTVRRPPAFYDHLIAAERLPLAELPRETRLLLGAVTGSPEAALAAPDANRTIEIAEEALHRFTSAESALVPWAGEIAEDPALFPEGQFDGDAQQVDLRPVNSWRLGLADVPTPELLEVHLVNAIAPFLLASRLKPLMQKTPGPKHVIHVSAMEASFSRKKKTINHPHTNMAKAALNMMTRTSAADYQRDGIYMNSVDTGWVTDEDPLHHAVRKQRDYDFHAPLDSVDGAARVLDPLFAGLIAGEHPWGLFFKDYRPVDW